MWAHSAYYEQGARAGYQWGVSAVHSNLSAHIDTQVPVTDGSVTLDARSNVRGSLTIATPRSTFIEATLAAPGGEITVIHTARYVDRTVEQIPLGVFIVDADSIKFGADGVVSMTCPDRWGKVQKNRFGLSRASVPSNTIWQEIKRLVEGAWPAGGPAFPGWSSIDSSVTAKVGPLLWDDGDREGAIVKMANAYGLEVFFNRQGLGVLRKVPMAVAATPSVWTVDCLSDYAVLAGGTLARDRSKLRNAVIVSASDSAVNIAPRQVVNANPADPLSTVGPLGFAPIYFSSPTLRTAAAMDAAGRTVLARQLARSSQLTIQAAPNMCLDPGDVIRVVPPPADAGVTPTTEVHVIESVTLPLRPDYQSISTRDTRPDDQDGVS